MPVSRRSVIIWPVQNTDVLEAARVSYLKHQYINDTFIMGRSFYEKYTASLIGDIAKLSFKRYLINKGFTVTDWDDFGQRPNWKTSRKLFDLKVNKHIIEVRSSISQYTDISDVLSNEHIIHPPRVNYKEINVQVFFKDKSLKEIWFCGWTLGSKIKNRRYLTFRPVNGRYIPFHMMNFNEQQANTITQLVSYL